MKLYAESLKKKTKGKKHNLSSPFYQSFIQTLHVFDTIWIYGSIVTENKRNLRRNLGKNTFMNYTEMRLFMWLISRKKI